MRDIKLVNTETVETQSVLKFDDGEVTMFEREIHEHYQIEEPAHTRLIIGDAIERTRNFIAKSRSEFAELTSIMQELRAK